MQRHTEHMHSRHGLVLVLSYVHDYLGLTQSLIQLRGVRPDRSGKIHVEIFMH